MYDLSHARGICGHRAAELVIHYAPKLFVTLFTEKALFNHYVQTNHLKTTRPFASIVFFEDKLMDPFSSTNQNTTWTGQKTALVWMKKIISFQHTPYPLTAFLDSDTCFCGPGELHLTLKLIICSLPLFNADFIHRSPRSPVAY